jgi:hypothetical protein
MIGCAEHSPKPPLKLEYRTDISKLHVLTIYLPIYRVNGDAKKNAEGLGPSGVVLGQQENYSCWWVKGSDRLSAWLSGQRPWTLTKRSLIVTVPPTLDLRSCLPAEPPLNRWRRSPGPGCIRGL